ncbi:hypothetical protein P5V15_003356 [Pogonomyrmex californicus]
MENNADMYVPAFYAGRSIFITGATGFLGKVLIEKLLRSCPDVAEIFVLIREKKGLSARERLKKMLDNKLFDVLRNEQSSSLNKVIPITGNVAAENLGLLPAEEQMLIERVSVIFHVAASVRFDESLKDAIFNNTRSTRDVCILAQRMKKIVVLLHISSTYTQTDKPIVEETLYPWVLDWRKVIKVAESVDEHILRIFTAKYLGTMPNTYTFSKRLAEQVISDYSDTLPCVIIRPSIVIATIDEPVKGWVDNFNGPVGLFIGGGKGILRVVLSDPCASCDFMPVDVAIKATLVAAWKRGIKTIAEDKTIDVYNCASNDIKKVDLRNIVQMAFEIAEKIPLEGIIWKPQTMITNNRFNYFCWVLLLHILPALFLDGILKLCGSRPMLLRLQRKVFVTNNALSYFLLNEWTFNNDKLKLLFDDLSADNSRDFGYNYRCIDIYDYFKNGLIGGKIYLLNESMDLEAARAHRKRMNWLDTIIKTLFFMVILWMLYYKNIFSYVTEILHYLSANIR